MNENVAVLLKWVRSNHRRHDVQLQAAILSLIELGNVAIPESELLRIFQGDRKQAKTAGVV